MKNLTLIIGGIILLLNLVIGMIFSAYKPFNIGLNSAVIVVNTLMLYLLGVAHRSLVPNSPLMIRLALSGIEVALSVTAFTRLNASS